MSCGIFVNSAMPSLSVIAEKKFGSGFWLILLDKLYTVPTDTVE